MKKILLALLLLLPFTAASAADYTIQIQLSNVAVSSHKVFIKFYNSEKDYNKTPFKTEIISADKEDILLTYTLPEGDYVITAFQDLNDNTKLDTNILGMPKEPVGISNYSGKGIPGGFKSLKLGISANGSIISITLKALKA